MRYYIGTIPVTPYLEHHGILGMKWGIRRYQNEDGTLTAEGRARYGIDATKTSAKELKERYDDYYAQAKKSGRSTNRSKVEAKASAEYKKTKEFKEYNDIMEMIAEVRRQYPNSEIELDEESGKYAMDVANKALKKQEEVFTKYLNEAAGATLKDLNYEDTAAGRAWLLKALGKKR